ncbi:hypothetical protein B0J18DRAFT_470298 [Chaetomium sp. MPI-SDFR-AT-0129]|nr:hypothetical protein B0J18DRAFT_470298 [Chaetomium sp. MPI-SDFR-AT-0129]
MESGSTTTADVREGTPPDPTNSEEPKAPVEGSVQSPEAEALTKNKPDTRKKSAKEKGSKQRSKRKSKKAKKSSSPAESSSSDSDSEDDEESSGSSSAESDRPDAEESRKKQMTKKRQGAQKAEKKEKKKEKKETPKRNQKPSKKHVDSSSDSDSDSDSSSGSDSDSGSSGSDSGSGSKKRNRSRRKQADLTKQLQQLILLQQQQQQQQGGSPYGYASNINHNAPPPIYDSGPRHTPSRGRRGAPRVSGQPHLNLHGLDPNLVLDPRQQDKKRQTATKLDYKRVDQVWDDSIHNYKLQDTAERTVDAQYDEFIFHVRRTFDWEGKYKATIVDIKSKLLRECLQDVIGDIKGISLVDDTPKLDPNMLFLYLEDLRKHMKELKKIKVTKGDKHDRKKEQKKVKSKRQHLKVLVKYIDKDYADTKNSLYPMLENGLITFDLLWALWKPGTLAYTTTYGSHDEPRVFKVEMAEKHHGLMKGDFYFIEGKYFEYDGKQHGFGNMAQEIGDFRGARKITSLSCYPLQYHKSEAQLRKDLIERGRKFVSLSGVHYKSHQGMAYYKKKKSVIKVNINGRIMIDPSIHRRINPNYPISTVRPKDHDVVSDDSEEDDSDDESGGCGCGSDSDDEGEGGKIKYVTKAVKDGKGKIRMIRLPKVDGEDGDDDGKEKLDKVRAKGDDAPQQDDDEEGKEKESTTKPQKEGEEDDEEDKDAKEVPDFTEEEYLIASPVVLGFAFAEKLWLEFTVSGVKEIQWNETAYESLVLEPKTKDIVKALVESHKYHAAESIDDVIQGKGKGLVAVLHGPPGTGKTLTAEGISELLKCPLYMVSAGELGTDSRYLESELQKILDICHAWGAILLLDEADVFLEKRNMHDIHRNALVSIFLRQLEYFQGILFLTTNRVETFDDAFQSRIHIALRYDNLDLRAKRAIFKIFIERVRVLEKVNLMPFSEEDYTTLARHELNGRQIKNTVRTAQALAVNKGEPLSMSHIRQVLEVQTNFERDLKGGPGYQDAMRSYF